MREIRFRAIHKLTKHWFEESNIVFKDGKWFEDYKALEDGRPMNLDQVAIMQYTGFKNKNGIEIYEGDALIKDGYWSFYIGFHEGSFVKIPCDSVQRVNWEWKRLTQYDVDFYDTSKNIYENPEFLGDRQ